MKNVFKFGIALMLAALLIIPAIISYAEPIYSDNIIPQMTSATTPSGVASASTTKSGFYPWHAFDRLSNAADNLNDWAATTIVSWIQYEFPSQKTVSKYTIKGSYAASATPTAWTLEGSNDGINWQVLDTRSGESWLASQVKSFTFSNTNAFTIYKLNISANGGHSFSIISEIEMMELIGETVPVPDAPVNLAATSGNALVDLNWTTTSGAETYNIKRSETPGGPYTSIATGVTGTTYNDTDVVNGTTYYYVVTAVNTSGESNLSNEASATPQAPVAAGQALLVVTMVNGLEKEYDLTMTEVNAFIDWYDNRAAGTGPERYEIAKGYNQGPFTSRKDNLVFDKIMTFEVMEYNAVQ